MTECWWSGGAIGLVALAACSAAPPVVAPVPAAAPVATPASPPGLPGFGGRFRGTMRTFGARPREVPMGLDVLPLGDGTWSWVMHYGAAATAERRDYELRVVDAAAGRFVIDERNGIVLAAQAVGDELVSVFTAGGQVLCVRYRAVPAGLEFALEAFDPAKAEPTGQGVGSVAAPASQRALLRRADGIGP